MTKYNKKITKEQYDRAMSNNGFIKNEDKNKIFTESEIFGYGVYMPRAVENHGEYYVTFNLGSSCD